MEFGFTKLEAYQRTLTLIDDVYDCSEAFPRREEFALGGQLRRAALSIAANIAEGAGRETAADRRRFYTMAKGSLFECVALLDVAGRRKYVPPSRRQSLLQDMMIIGKMISGLMNSLSHLR